MTERPTQAHHPTREPPDPAGTRENPSSSDDAERRMVWIVLPVAAAAVLLMLVLATRNSALDRKASSRCSAS